MAGGIFVDQNYHPNPKCLLFSSLIMALYWFSPAIKNSYMLPVIFVVSYVAMAWYDYLYKCEIMYSGKSIGPNTFDAIFKPQYRNKIHKKQKLSKNQEQEYLRRVYLFHIIAVVPVLLYIGYSGNKSNKKIYPVLLSLGIMALFYHAIRIFIPRETMG
jgi:hypothetical protein